MNSLHQHLGEFLPLDTTTEDALLTPISQTLNSGQALTNSKSGQQFDFSNKKEDNGTDEGEKRKKNDEGKKNSIWFKRRREEFDCFFVFKVF